MGLSRNKVAVSEGAAGSPPFYGECEISLTDISYLQIGKKTKGRKTTSEFSRLYGPLVVQFSVTDEKSKYPFNGGVAQLGEHLPCKQGVMGSIPIISTRARWRRSY